jgi:quinol monooxygenase YgiN
MAVIVIAEARGQTASGYDAMFEVLAEKARQAPGFVLHSAFCADGSWRVVEVWRSKAEANSFYARQVVPHLPTGVHPKRQVHEAHSLVMLPQSPEERSREQPLTKPQEQSAEVTRPRCLLP